MGQIMIFVFVALWGAGWLLAYFWRRPKTATAMPSAEKISIIIPARNEAHNIPKLLKSIRAQSIRTHEVIVVDDGSTDGTAAIAKQFGATVIAPPPLPEGWRGKTWACHQGALKASGSHLLFVDADTWFEPNGLASVMQLRDKGAVSIAPYHAVEKPYEDLSLFFNLSMIAGTVPHGLLGQLLFVAKTNYHIAGGHEAVKGNVLENFRLAQKFREASIPVTSIIGKGIFSFRMYPQGLPSLIEGWTKGFAAGAGGTPPLKMFLVITWMIGLMMPPMMLLKGESTWTWGGAYILCVWQLLWIARAIGSFSSLLLILYPLPLVFFFGLFARAKNKSGKTVQWKGRDIHAD